MAASTSELIQQALASGGDSATSQPVVAAQGESLKTKSQSGK